MGKLSSYINKHVSKMGAQLVYAVLLLYFAYQQSDTPRWAKSTVIGAFAYLLSPLDSIPDLTPFIGFTDDMGVVMFALVTIACYINSDVRQKAKKQLFRLLPKAKSTDLASVDARL